MDLYVCTVMWSGYRDGGDGMERGVEGLKAKVTSRGPPAVALAAWAACTPVSLR